MFNAPVRGPEGDLVVALVVLGVCEIHRQAVQEWSAARSVSDGVYVQVEDLADVDRLSLLARRTDSAAISNADGPLLVA